uniref:Fanconi Anaemia group E protein C-terminal domain-containing protein n=1 Tax=Tetradesmus obliquus TaxID=3088 RepID=A0A383VKL8_TETOB|eukprot:jgi/Sobl393_1/10300/SZX64916.1
MSALLCMPIQLELAKALVACGARFTFAQLLAAVASRAAVTSRAAAGIACSELESEPKVWMQAYRARGLALPAGMPAVAEALCCGDEFSEDMLGPEGWCVSEGPTATPPHDVLLQQLQDVLVLALKVQQEDLEEEQLDQLEQLLELPAAQQLSPEALQHILDNGIQVQSAHLDGSMTLLLELPAAQQLSPSCVAELLKDFAEQRSSSAQHLLALPAAQQLETEFVVQMLEDAVASDRWELVPQLLRLPAGQQMSSAALQKLLKSAVKAASINSIDRRVSTVTAALDCMEAIRTFPAARQVPSSSVAELLQTAVERHRRDVAMLLIQLPTAQQVSSSIVVQLLQAATQDHDLMLRLGDLPAAQQLSIDALAALLQAAVMDDACCCSEDVLAMPAAQQLNAVMLGQLLQRTRHLDSRAWPEAMRRLAQLPAAQQLNGDTAAVAAVSAAISTAAQQQLYSAAAGGSNGG